MTKEELFNSLQPITVRKLEVRNTRKYNDDCRHKDDWTSIGDVYELHYLVTSETDYEHGSKMMFVRVDTYKPEAVIRQALKDTYTREGCSCLHDCCGCINESVNCAEPVAKNIWVLGVSWSRNL